MTKDTLTRVESGPGWKTPFTNDEGKDERDGAESHSPGCGVRSEEDIAKGDGAWKLTHDDLAQTQTKEQRRQYTDDDYGSVWMGAERSSHGHPTSRSTIVARK
ncbi:MAG: hypothetical protein H7318_20770 [Oligoflexus sp.]|nr:hypothetical protein [Oligoflexus sp.]